jgi:phosphatidylglycerophosphate synthase
MSREISLNRTLARWLVPWLIRLGLHAHQVTALSLLAGWGAGWAFAQGNPVGFFVGAGLFCLANLLDECDGQVARARGQASGLGSWFDTVTGSLVHMIVFFGVGLGLSRSTGNPMWIALGVWTALGVFVSTAMFVGMQVWARGRPGWIHPDPPHGMESRPLDRLKLALRADFPWVVWLTIPWGGLRWVLWGALAGTFLFWIPSEFRSALRLRRMRGWVGR